MADEVHQPIPAPAAAHQRDAKEKTTNQLPETNVVRTEASVANAMENPLGNRHAAVVAPYNPDPIIAQAEKERKDKEDAAKARQVKDLAKQQAEQAQQ